MTWFKFDLDVKRFKLQCLSLFFKICFLIYRVYNPKNGKRQKSTFGASTWSWNCSKLSIFWRSTSSKYSQPWRHGWIRFWPRSARAQLCHSRGIYRCRGWRWQWKNTTNRKNDYRIPQLKRHPIFEGPNLQNWTIANGSISLRAKELYEKRKSFHQPQFKD